MTTVLSPPAVRPVSLRGLTEFLAVGGITLVFFPLAWFAKRAIGSWDADFVFGATTFYAAYVINDPHFSVTYLLFYKDARTRAFDGSIARAQRVRWWLAGVVAPIVLVAWAVWALVTKSAQTLGWMVQLMYLLVGWHYVKQGFGVLAVLCARRGVAIPRWSRVTILAHCYAGWAFAWSNPALRAGEYEEKGVVFWAPGRPLWFEIAMGTILAASTIAMIVVLARPVLKRELPLVPLSGLLITVWSWTIFSTIDPLVQYVIPALHSIQYLFFVWLMKRNQARAREGPPEFGRPVLVELAILSIGALGLGWLLFHGIPDFFDDAFVPRSSARTALGATPWLAAFTVFVNIHHYFMDAVIWRRENPDTRWLRG